MTVASSGLDARSKLFVVLAGLFVTSLIVGDLIGGKLYEVDIAGRSFPISVGMIPFPIVFLLTDLINEFYGRRAARFVTWLGFAMAWSTIAFLQVAAAVPWAAFTRADTWQGVTPSSFDNVFMSSTRILLASTIAYLTAQLIDIAVFHFVKRRLGDRLLWLRATGSTVVSQLVDTVVIQILAWYQLMPVDKIIGIVAISYMSKVVIAVGLTPLIYAGHALVERGLGLEPIHARELAGNPPHPGR